MPPVGCVYLQDELWDLGALPTSCLSCNQDHILPLNLVKDGVTVGGHRQL